MLFTAKAGFGLIVSMISWTGQLNGVAGGDQNFAIFIVTLTEKVLLIIYHVGVTVRTMHWYFYYSFQI